MFDFDEKYLYPMGKPPHPPNDGCGHHPHHHPPYTMTEEMQKTMCEMRQTIQNMVMFEKRIADKYEEHIRTLTADNVLFKQTFADSHTAFIRDVQNEINVFEGNMNALWSLFESTIRAEIDEAVAYMKTNLSDSIAESVGELKESGDLADIIEGEVFSDFESRLSRSEKMFKTPEQYGAIGDGIANDDNAINACIADLKSGDVLVLNGKYLVSRVLIENLNNIRVEGTGGFVLAENAYLHAIEFNNCRNLTIDGIEIDGKNAPARALNIYNVSDFEIRNVYIHDVGNNTVDNSIYGIILVNSHNGRIVNPHVKYVHAKAIATGINMESDGVNVNTTPTNIVIDGALIEDISPYDDGDGVKVLGTVVSNITVMNSTFKKCAKRAMKFQSIGCTSFNNKVYSDGTMYACIDFQRKDGKSLNDTIYVDVPANPDVTGLGYYAVCCSDNTVVDGLNVHVNGNDNALYGNCTSCNLFGIQNLGNDSFIRVVIKNCNIDAWGYFLKNVADMPCDLVVDNVYIDRMYMNYLFTGGEYTHLTFTNNRIVQKPRSWFIFAHDTNCEIGEGNIDLTNVMTVEWNVSDLMGSLGSHITARCGHTSFVSGSFTYENGKTVFYSSGTNSPQIEIYSSGKWFALAKVGDICYPRGVVYDGDNALTHWVCISNPDDTYKNGVWQPVYVTVRQ